MKRPTMKKFESVLLTVLIFVAMTSFSQCSSSRKLQKKAPDGIGQVYCQRWVAGVEGGGSGLNIFIPVTNAELLLDSVYFRGKAAKLEFKKEAMMFVGRYTSEINKKKDLILSGDPKEEYGNEMPKIEKPIPFKLEENECVLSYQEGDETKYFKVTNVVEKQTLAFPSAPQGKQ